jgi:hypothetical protein
MRQLQRLRKEHRLPEPYWLPRIDRLRTGIYPIFALAGIVGGPSISSDLQERVGRLRDEVFGCAAFREMAGAFREAVAALEHDAADPTWRFGEALNRLGNSAGSAVAEWRGVIDEAEEDLEHWGVRLSSELGSIESTHGQDCVVAVATHREHFPLNRVVSPVRSGGVVTIQRVAVLDRGMDFVMPTINIDLVISDQLDWSIVASSDWELAITNANEAGRGFSFNRSYWEDDVHSVASGAPFSFAGVPSGREAAEKLLHARAIA